ncbi:MAG: tetratricopeptide repeat protein, partial [Promethearchaeota archaeon]
QKQRAHIWNYYATQSLEDNFYRDYMNREVTANYHLNKGKHLIMLGGIEAGLRRLKLASQIGYNDDLIHTELSLLLTDFGFLDEAREELEKSLIYSENLAGVYNNWGYYYYKLGDLDKTIDSFNRAIQLDPENILFYNNLGSILLDAGKIDSAIKVFRKSLLIDSSQERILKIVKEHDLRNGDGE